MPAVATETVKFRSDNRGLRVIRRSRLEMHTPTGERALVATELAYQFELGWLELEPGQDMAADGPWSDDLGGPVEQDAISWMRQFAASSLSENRVHEVLPEARPVAELLHELAEAQIAGDLEMVQLIGDEEAVSFARPEVLSRAKLAYDALTAPPPKK